MRRLLVFLALFCTAAAAEEHYFEAHGARLRYVERGTGTPVVLLHGFGGSIERPWIEYGILDDLARDHRVIALDLRGHGRSDKPHDPSAYTPIALDVVALLDHLRIPRAHIVGYSLGGIIGLKLLTTHPQRFASAVIAGAAHRRHGAPAEADAREILNGPIPYRALILSTWPTDESLPSEEALLARSRQIVAVNDALAHAALLRARAALVVKDEDLAAVPVPALAVIGSADPMLPRVQRMAKIWKGLKVTVVQGATHPVAHPRSLARRPEFVAAVRAFIAAQAASDSGATSSTLRTRSSTP